ncbi:MAG TPA: hypothetical protein VGM93_04760 [Acidimicrobiales bacterium]|jgi:hypothetical protein
MPVAADPQLLTRYSLQTNDLAGRLSGAAQDVTAAMAAARRGCPDDPPATKPVGTELTALAVDWRRHAARSGVLADALWMADAGALIDGLRAASANLPPKWVHAIERLLSGGPGDLLHDGFPWPIVYPLVEPLLAKYRENSSLVADARLVVDIGRTLLSAIRDGLVAAGLLGADNELVAWAVRDSALASLVGPEIVAANGAQAVARDLVADYQAWHDHKSGITKAEAVSKTVFDAGGTVCAVAPNPYACIPAAAAGATWAGLELWDHRKVLALGANIATALATEEARAHLAALRAALERGAGPALAAGRSLGDLLSDLANDPIHTPDLVPPGVRHIVDDAKHAAGVVETGAKAFVSAVL